MPHLRFRRSACLCLASALLSVGAAASTVDDNNPRVVVPDHNNNRVLIYNHPVANGQRADIVLGQSSFSTAASGTSDTTMASPAAYAFDKNGNLYISDINNCRVLQFRAPFSNGQAASAVLGKPDFITPCGGSVSSSNTGTTAGLVFDKSGNLWVSDAGNDRVLHFKAPFTNGKAADIVLGQPDFVTVSTSCNATPTAASLCRPLGLAFDSSGVLYIADSGNNRIVGYKTLKTKASASVELGHPPNVAFTSGVANDGGISARTLQTPVGIGMDSKNRLWVTDSQNNRVVRFDSKFHNGDAAVLVLGQADFLQNLANRNLGTANASTLNAPQGIFVRNSGDVWVGDSFNHRTLRYKSTFSNGMDSLMVLGQPGFTQNLANQGNLDPSDQSQSSPFDSGPSFIALTVLGGLAAGRQWMLRFKRRS